MPPALLEEVFALNEELDEIRELRERAARRPSAWKARLERARAADRGEARRARSAAQESSSARWDALVDAGRDERRSGDTTLDALRERMLERNYINNLLAGIERS